MKKNLFFLFALICSMSLFTACSDDDEPDYTPVIEEQIAGDYKGMLAVSMTTEGGNTTTFTPMPQKISVTKASATAISLSITDFTFMNIPVGDINLSNCPLTQNGTTYSFNGTTQVSASVLTADVNATGTVSNGTISLDLDITATVGEMEQDVTVTYTGTKLDGTEGTAAEITAFTFGEGVLSGDVTIADNSITFNVLDGVDITNLAPTITVSEGATVTPASGVAQDFTNAVTYTVVSEDYSTTKTYTVSVNGIVTVYDFENWTAGVEGQEPDMTFYEPTGWASSNPGAQMLKGMSYTDSYVVMETNDAHSGEKAALIKTIDSKGSGALGFLGIYIPKVTTGSLFLGSFITDATNTLNSTKFGIPYSQKPVSLKGWYKYTPGAEFYNVTETPYDKHCHEAVLDETKSDEFIIGVVLYETDGYDTEEWSDCLTGVNDAENNIYNSSRIAAIAQLTGGEQTEWTNFELPLEWKKEYNAETKYRLAIVCSSSKDGDKFSGAPGSTLIVDDFELTVE